MVRVGGDPRKRIIFVERVPIIERQRAAGVGYVVDGRGTAVKANRTVRAVQPSKLSAIGRSRDARGNGRAGYPRLVVGNGDYSGGGVEGRDCLRGVAGARNQDNSSRARDKTLIG